jgi:hypothetical protein
MHNSRVARLAYYGVPMLVCLAVHWVALKTWFATDDFAWLGLHLSIHSPRDFFEVVFSPMAEGTTRVLSERLYFLVFTSIFGINAAPFRLWVFLTQFVNIALLAWIARRVTGSSVAGFIAAVLWTVNSGISMAIGWSSAYNQILVAFFLLLSFFFLLKYIDTGARKYLAAQWAAFLLGFGAQELMVMYPVIAAGYTLCCARKHFRGTLALFVPSILFTAFHLVYVPMPTDSAYKMHFDAGLISTAWKYWVMAVAASRPDVVDWRPLWLGMAGAIAITACLVIFAAKRARERDWLPLLLLACFFVLLLPVLPFKNHFTEYYVISPSIGLSILMAMALVSVWRAQSKALLAAAMVLTALYLVVSVSDNYIVHEYYYRRGRGLHHLIDALIAERKTVRTPMVLLSGVDSDCFWSGFPDDVFRLIGVSEVYLVPGTEGAIDRHPEWGGISRFVISRKDAWQALRDKRAEVYALDGRRLKRLTADYQQRLGQQYLAEHPNFADAGDPLFASRLGPTWYPEENGFRWMPKTASVHLSAPNTPQPVLYVTGYTPDAVVAKEPQEVAFRLDGRKVGTLELKTAGEHFEHAFPLPSDLAGKSDVELTIEVARTVQVPGEVRTFGLVFGTFTIR